MIFEEGGGEVRRKGKGYVIGEAKKGEGGRWYRGVGEVLFSLDVYLVLLLSGIVTSAFYPFSTSNLFIAISYCNNINRSYQ